MKKHSFLSVLGVASYGVQIVAYFLLSSVENKWLDSPTGGFFKVSALVAAYFGLLYMFQALEKRKRDSGRAETKEGSEKPDDARRNANRSASSFMVKAFGDTLYQLFRGRERLYIVRLGYEAEPNSALMIASEEAFTPARGNESISLGDILEVRANPGRAIRPSLRIRARGRTRRFVFLEFTSREEVERYFEGLPVRIVETGLRSHAEEPEPTEEQKRRFVPYRRISVALAIAGGVCAALWLFTSGENKLFEALILALPVVAFLTYCAHFQALQPIKVGERSGYVYWSCAIPLMALLVKNLHDFEIGEPLKAALPATMIVLPAVAIFAAFVWGRKPELNRVLSVLMCVAFFSTLAAVRLNSLLDDGTRVTFRDVTVDYKNVDRDVLRPTRFLLHFSDKGEFHKIRAPRELYDALEEGDKVTIVTRTGSLGIPYSFAQPISSGGATPPP